ncbi:MAG: PDR/VanB family oxidoreductase [Usitatibacter sp.]
MDRLSDLLSAQFQEPSLSTSDPARLKLTIQSVTDEAEGILGFTLVDPQGGVLPAYEAGAHIDVHVAPHLVRQYSIAGDPAERGRYVIAVLKEPAGRGGSQAVHETFRPGQVIEVSTPRNHFRLSESPDEHLLLGAGIGVTPMMAMIASLEARGARWHMHYCTRSPERTAFRERLAPLVDKGKVTLHHDGGNPERSLDLRVALAAAKPGTHVYYCGPPGFMAAVGDAVREWPAKNVHFEHFSAPTRTDDVRPNGAFQIKLKSSGEVFVVPADKSIVQVLRENGHEVDTSCEDGFCGTCLTSYVEGEPEHRDTFLDDNDRRRQVLICCARSKSSMLVLDL